jgi:hypothetical protein
MRAGAGAHGELLERRERLFTPDPRLGWVFRDRWWFLKPFTEPAPQRRDLPEYLERRVTETERTLQRRMSRTLPLSLGAGVLLLVLAGCSQSDYALSRTPLPVGSVLLALIAAAPGGLLTLTARQQHQSAVNALELAHRQIVGGYENEVAAWHQRHHAHDANEHTRLNGLPEWGPVPRPDPLRRLDVFGGTLWSWEALLTTYGTSALATQPLLLLDLSRELVCAELIELAQQRGISVDAQRLPTHLAASHLLSGLTVRELVDVIVESMHADNTMSSRADRSMDDRILTRICDALGDEITLARIGAALRALMGEPDDGSALSRDERRRVTN